MKLQKTNQPKRRASRMMLPRFFQFENYNVIDIKEFLSDRRIEIHLSRKDDAISQCSRCGSDLGKGAPRGDHSMRIESLPIFGNRTFINLRRYRFHCQTCNKARSEAVPFLSQLSPHLTSDYGWWLGRFCEIAAVRRVAEFVGKDGMTLWRLDYNRMIQMLSHYSLPKVRRLSVDEVYVRRPSRHCPSREKCFLTVITDLDTRKVIWVTDTRSKAGLDQFFQIFGAEACRQVEVVAIDQHDAFKASVQEYCPQAIVVWDRFHIIKNFEDAVNETRKEIIERTQHDVVKQRARGKYRFLFLKKASRRTESERDHIEEVMHLNHDFYKLELIKERMITFFDQPTLEEAKRVFDEVGDWIFQSHFKPLMDWHNRLEKGWETLKNYFTFRVTTSLSEAINNVIKSVIRRGFGYRNLEYFKLKIMQVCGYLNSKYMPVPIQ